MSSIGIPDPLSSTTSSALVLKIIPKTQFCSPKFSLLIPLKLPSLFQSNQSYKNQKKIIPKFHWQTMPSCVKNVWYLIVTRFSSPLLAVLWGILLLGSKTCLFLIPSPDPTRLPTLIRPSIWISLQWLCTE